MQDQIAASRRGDPRWSRPARLSVAVTVLTTLVAGALAVTYGPEAWDRIREVFGTIVLRDLVERAGPAGPVVFLLVQVAQVVFVPIPGGATAVVGALLFGTWGGLGLGLAGAVVGSLLVFGVGRRWGRPLVARMVGESTLGRYLGLFDAKGWLLFAAFLLPFLPDDALCAIAGVSRLSFRRFVVLVAVGRLPSMALTVFGATGLLGTSVTVWAPAAVGLAVAVALLVHSRARVEAWLVGRVAPEGARA